MRHIMFDAAGHPLSDRGFRLEWDASVCPLDFPVVTVEDYSKWYNLYLVKPDGELERLELTEKDLDPYLDENDTTSVCGHCWNPRAVYRWSEAQGYHTDLAAYERLVGRWEIEVQGRY